MFIIRHSPDKHLGSPNPTSRSENLVSNRLVHLLEHLEKPLRKPLEKPQRDSKTRRQISCRDTSAQQIDLRHRALATPNQTCPAACGPAPQDSVLALLRASFSTWPPPIARTPRRPDAGQVLVATPTNDTGSFNRNSAILSCPTKCRDPPNGPTQQPLLTVHQPSHRPSPTFPERTFQCPVGSGEHRLR